MVKDRKGAMSLATASPTVPSAPALYKLPPLVFAPSDVTVPSAPRALQAPAARLRAQ